MDGFLSSVARHLYGVYGSNLQSKTIIFVSRRAQIYFDAALSGIAIGVTPTCTTIDKFITSQSDLKLADKLTLLTTLYGVYGRFFDGENFENFYSFGELLLNDFDTVDRYLVDARSLYSDLSDGKDIDVGGDDAAAEAALEFWRSFRSSKAEQYEQHKFIKVWRSLFQIYSDFRTVLRDQGIAYQGMIYRDVANLSGGSVGCAGGEVFVGLNALSVSETKILQGLKGADFYWDYSQSWIDNRDEAAYFIAQNIKKFPQAAGFEYQNEVNCDVQLSVVDTPSEILQCKVVASELSAMDGVDERTAIILTDEKLLEPLLYSIPDSVDAVNISMGYPLRLTQCYGFVELLLALQRGVVGDKFYHVDVENLLRHPYISMVDFAAEIAVSQNFRVGVAALPVDFAPLWVFAGNRFELNDYLICVLELVLQRVESDFEKSVIARMSEEVANFNGILLGCSLQISRALYVKLLMERIGSSAIDFEGFSGRGMQVMGILESRSLDFDNVVVLSMSDDNFPSASPSPSYIPFTLRRGFGMPSLAEHSAIWSYYFFRLLNRARRVTMVYCSATNDSSSGEPSRYISQIRYCSNYKLTSRSFVANTVKSSLAAPIVVKNNFERGYKKFSPSALSRYIDCPLKFYFHDVASIKERRVADEAFTALDSGNALHSIFEDFYKNGGSAEQCVERYFGGTLASKITLNPGSASILRRVVERMVSNVLRYDSTQDFKVIKTEQAFDFQVGDFAIAGIIDRVDAMGDGSLRVVDYKSGGDKAKFDSVAALFGDDVRGHNHAVLQLLVYCLAVSKSYSGGIRAALYRARAMGDGYFNPLLVFGKEHLEFVDDGMLGELQTQLTALVDKIYSEPFTQAVNVQKCTYCPYATICGR